jgi:uncharacterized protein (TIGR00730 family)
MPAIRSVAVFCGARLGFKPDYQDAARALGQGLAEAGIRLVYGGGRVGMMGAVADAVLAGGGTVLGVIPEFLTKLEVAHPGATEMVVTTSMHARKQLMAEQSDAFIAMPGGLGTLDEIVEIITWRLLGLHDKPILVCNVAGSAIPLQTMLEATIEQGFASPEARDTFEIVDGVPAVLTQLRGLPAGSPGSGDRF